MVKRKRLVIRRYIAGSLRDVEASAHTVATATEDGGLFELAEELKAAEHMLQAAATELGRAERQLQRTTLSPEKELPAWFVTREEADAAARALVESLCEEIAATPAHSKAGLAIKLRVLAALFQDDPTPIS